ncbi:unnamed protein product [Dracunculus medinensis]|uniref:DDRGK domain-containing protein 1 n=1 Tax=Dracunculus medinensis TaxID=318479 RepID=A0A0N4UJM4_DRAME|nr:unnamed protein product [Dracunculus medinensis]
MIDFDPLFLGSVGFLLTALVLIVARIIKLHYDEKRAHQRTETILAMAADEDNQRRMRNAPQVIGGRRRVVTRRRFHTDDGEDRSFARQLGDQATPSDEENVPTQSLKVDEHIGKKKMAKLQAKAEKKAQREAEIANREEKKLREKEREERMKQEEEARLQEEKAEEEKKRIEKMEREKREEEEYQKMKAEFCVDEEGFDELESDLSEDLVQKFLKYIKETKVVNMDELGSHFNLKTDQAVDRLKYFMDSGELTGIVDDRGKFIYITPEELQAVAKFINQRGRVSLKELADYSNQLIRLEST